MLTKYHTRNGKSKNKNIFIFFFLFPVLCPLFFCFKKQKSCQIQYPRIKKIKPPLAKVACIFEFTLILAYRSTKKTDSFAIHCLNSTKFHQFSTLFKCLRLKTTASRHLVRPQTQVLSVAVTGKFRYDCKFP
jgi:hypothetical protein